MSIWSEAVKGAVKEGVNYTYMKKKWIYSPDRVKKDNPFYHNYVFHKEDLEREKNTKPWWEFPWLFLLPTWVQINDGYAFFYKQHGNQYFLVGHEGVASQR